MSKWWRFFVLLSDNMKLSHRLRIVTCQTSTLYVSTERLIPVGDVDRPLSNTRFLGPTRVLNPNGISIVAAVFAGLTVTDRPTDRPTDHATRSVTKRPHLHTYNAGDAA